MTTVKQDNVLIVWAYANFLDIHAKKDPGGIPHGFASLGYKSTLVVGRMLYNGPRDYNVIEGFTVGRNRFDRFLMELREISGLVKSFKPKIVLIYNTSRTMHLAVAVQRFVSKIFSIGRNQNTKFILKMDTEGRVPTNKKHKFRFAIHLNLRFLSFHSVIVETECARANLLPIVIRKKGVKVVPDGYSDVHFEKIGYDCCDRKPIVLTVSRMVEGKGLDLLIKSFAEISTEFPEWELHIAGQVIDERYRENLVELSKSLGLDKKAKFHYDANEAELKDLYYSSSIFAHLSQAESFGIVRAEAMACGIPVLTTPAGCGKELTKFGVHLVEYGDVKGAANSLRKLMSNGNLRSRVSQLQQGAIMSYPEIAQLILNIC